MNELEEGPFDVWISVDDNGIPHIARRYHEGGCLTEASALATAERERDILADKVQFMGAQLVSLEASREYLLSQTEEFRNKRDEAKRELAELRREVASMRPVANAAIALELLNMGHYHEAHDGAEQFVDAVNRYMATTPHEVNHEPERN